MGINDLLQGNSVATTSSRRASARDQPRAHSDDGSITEASTAGTSSQDGNMDDNPCVGLGGCFNNAFDNTRKAIANQQESGGKVSMVLPNL